MSEAKCMVCGGMFPKDGMRMNAAVPVWMDENWNGKKSEPFACGIRIDICEKCYQKAAVLRASRNEDELIEFKPFPAEHATLGRAMRAKCRAIEYDGDDGFDEEWWRQLVCDEDGVPDMEKAMADFHDFHMLIRSASEVYEKVTDGQITKPNTAPWEVVSAVEDITTRLVEEALAEQAEELKGE